MSWYSVCIVCFNCLCFPSPLCTQDFEYDCFRGVVFVSLDQKHLQFAFVPGVSWMAGGHVLGRFHVIVLIFL